MYIPKPLEDKVTVPQLRKLKQQGEKFACLTAYDYSFACLMEDCGVEVVLVGDSLGMVVQGHDTTIPVTLADIEYHGRIVAAGLDNAMLMLDMPFGSLNSPQQALDNASELLKRTQAQVVKLEHAGTDILLLECVPAPLAAEITAVLEIPVIGIGAGADVDGQILVLHDVLNVTAGKKPKFSKNFMQGQSSIQSAISRYVHEVKRGQFPDKTHSFS
jgi:3-methyl-2-oxobutanoate hydroxymethyltransferase